jgi:putative transcriptional regulator
MALRTRPNRGNGLRGLSILLAAVLLTTAEAQPVRVPEPGVLLVADEDMTDPRFRETVLLVVRHDDTGSWGVIINRPTHVELAELQPELSAAGGNTVYFGGPLRLDRLIFLYRHNADDEPGPEGRTGLPGVRWSDLESLPEARLASDPERIRAYAGYAGWAPGQLAFELARGSWGMIQGRPENVFSDHPERLWRRLTAALDGLAI